MKTLDSVLYMATNNAKCLNLISLAFLYVWINKSDFLFFLRKMRLNGAKRNYFS
jgi:hypothetical protein